MKWQEKIKNLTKNPWSHLIFLALLLALFYGQTSFNLMAGGWYQLFVEKIVDEGQIDFSLPGFHGADFITLPIYYFFRSSRSTAILDIAAAFLNIFLIYLAVKEIFKNKKFGIFAAYLYLLNPFTYANAFRGDHHTPMITFTLLGLYLLFKNSKLAFFAFGLSYISRPFAVALFPLFIYRNKIRQFILSLSIPLIYVIAEYWQTGKIMIGEHPDFTPANLFSLKRFALNLIYAFQNYFSVHNYSFLNSVAPGDMIHLSPFISFLALIGILNYKKYFPDKKLFYSLLISAAIALFIPASFYHLDMWYLWVFNFLLILLALPVLVKFTKIIPLVALSFFFQFFYVYLTYRHIFWNGYGIFLIPGAILIVSLIYLASQFLANRQNNYNA
ncbi:MAG: hypothetical protein A3J65_04635 [Candidatus Buchananbacteria bacterium RIFCSPHIGHO2_02_FULL_45_11b]|uniref:Glycosyltransferase RgtA/B/C/D-like domain-containing protein n=2 Tax=Candidatus Buchananiibacteriota TaxID=1817903 RepID=A0A1G1YD60_9BACT|nr:MAG: hypothetical protein A3J65_04635 [Candidatus Buchananbacteria bacterium RIFCSPHIGHO2_02_FULL_45_11b]OGY58055.1 MAG: hypothetical protein A3H67_01135 [Candidatus Buchananbacteria bacterium RIFCSPLOWO2_02_FULL_46_11b]